MIAERQKLIRKPRRKWLRRERSRHGNMCFYFRRGDGPRVRLPNDYGSSTFWEAYDAALKGEPIARAKPVLLRARIASQQKSMVASALVRALKGAKARTRKTKRPFDLTLEWATATAEAQRFRCALSGALFYADASARDRRNPYMPSIDRIDCSKGYTQDNCRLVLLAINSMLMDWGVETFERIVNLYKSNKRMNGKRKSAEPVTTLAAPQNDNNEIKELRTKKS